MFAFSSDKFYFFFNFIFLQISGNKTNGEFQNKIELIALLYTWYWVYDLACGFIDSCQSNLVTITFLTWLFLTSQNEVHI